MPFWVVDLMKKMEDMFMDVKAEIKTTNQICERSFENHSMRKSAFQGEKLGWPRKPSQNKEAACKAKRMKWCSFWSKIRSCQE